MGGGEDTYLVRRAQEGYLDAFEELLRRHRDKAYRVALRLLAHPADAEDATQEALVQAWQSLPDFRGDSAFSSWLYRIVVNKARDHQRRTRPTVALDPDSPDDDRDRSRADPASLGSDPAGLVEADQRSAALRLAVAGLAFELRAPLVLREFERCSYAETALILGLPEATVRGRLARGRQALAQQMRGW